MLNSKRENKKQLLLETAKKLLISGELATLTLDAIAKTANVSKGGLLYHFPTKEVLLNELATSIFAKMQERFLEIAEQIPINPSRYTTALIQVTKEDLLANAELNVALLAQTAISADLKKQVSKLYLQILAYLDQDQLIESKKQITRLALDGLYYNQLFMVVPPSREEIDKTLHHLKEFITEET